MQPQSNALQIPASPLAPNSAENYLARGMSLHQSGSLGEAEKEYRRALKRAPDRADILHLIGLVAHQSGRNGEAVKLIRRAIRRAPKEISYRVNQAIVLNALGRWREAEKACQTALKLQPGHSEANNNLGRALSGLNRADAARHAYEAAIEADSENTAAHNNLGLLHMQAGRVAEAIECFLNAIRINPGFTLALTNMATAYMSAGRLGEAEQACRQALGVDPNLISALHSLGTIMSARGELQDAEAAFRRVLALDAGHLHGRINLASVKSSQGSYDEAEALFEMALTAAPDSAEAHLNLGFCKADRGHLEEALRCFRRAIACDPLNVEAYYALATSGRPEFDDQHRANIDALSRAKGLSMDRQVKLQFVLAAVASGGGDQKMAFHFCRQGNDLRKILLGADGQAFDAASHADHLRAIAGTFSTEFFAERPELGETDARPIFIIGMPRSGTTLAERVISSHPGAQGAGERDDIPRLIERATGFGAEGARFLDLVSGLSPDQCDDLARFHLGAMAGLVPGGVLLADKTPFNFLNLGFIALLFPNARIVHCRRDPRDVGLSCYLTNFAQAHAWSCDLGDIGHYITAHDVLMDHWRSVLPIEILEFDYEAFVADTENGARRLIGYLGLDWDPQCLDFHASKDVVQTASKWQGRQPIYNSSIGRWRAYREELAPLLAALDASGV